MGSGICTAALLAGIQVTLKEINEKFLEVSPNSKKQIFHDLGKIQIFDVGSYTLVNLRLQISYCTYWLKLVMK